MGILRRKSSTGMPAVDKNLDHIIKFINQLGVSGGSSGTTTVNQNMFFTDIGGIAVRITNSSGILLPKGYLTKFTATSTSNNATIVAENDFEATGAVWEDIPAYGIGYIIISGYADVYFNSNGATSGHGIRMSRDDDTVNTDTGKAASVSTNEIDIQAYIGLVTADRTGEGLSRAIIKR